MIRPVPWDRTKSAAAFRRVKWTPNATHLPLSQCMIGLCIARGLRFAQRQFEIPRLRICDADSVIPRCCPGGALGPL
jgi:hypothetical protein